MAALSMLALGCSNKATLSGEGNEAPKLSGVWQLESRVIDEHVVPAEKRRLRFEFKEDGTFSAFYRYDETMEWTRAGAGALLYTPPKLIMFWNDGRQTQLIVLDHNDNNLKLHHGRNLVPLEDQLPQEIFLSISGKRSRS